MPATKEAPGLLIRTRRNGAQVAYWRASAEFIKQGYEPKLVRLHYQPGDPRLIARCYTLHAEMLTWAAHNKVGRPTTFDGTFASLVAIYETDRDSPYFELKQTTQLTYSKTMKSLMKHKGALRVDCTTAADVRRWYKELTEAVSRSWAYYTVNVLKSVLSYGATKRITECTMLREELRSAKFHGGAQRKEKLTHEQVTAFCISAHALGLPWMARCLRIQFDFGMRRRDVIGEYIRDETATASIRVGRKVWQDGLTWGHIDEHGVVRKMISKTEFSSALVAVHAVADYADVEAELASTPPDKRIGPIIINPRTGVPPTDVQCRWHFRIIATHAGIPENVWMMDARAGANTESNNAGATAEERMALLTHTQEDTNQGYVRDLTEPSRRAAAKRIAYRKK